MIDSDSAGDERPEHEDPPYIDLVVGPNHEVDNRNFGRMLGEFRHLAGLTRVEAAARLEMSAEYLRLIELGRRTPAMGQMDAFIRVYRISGELGRLQPGGDRPDLILLPPHADEPVTVDFASRIREARRRGSAASANADTRRDALRQSESNQPAEGRATELGYILLLLATADDGTLAKVYDILEASAHG
jgi:transcriptional regulator with XRE-family HTH domain